MLPYCHKTETLIVKEVGRCYLTFIRQSHVVKEVARCYLTFIRQRRVVKEVPGATLLS